MINPIKDIFKSIFGKPTTTNFNPFAVRTELIAYTRLNPTVESLMTSMLNICPKLVLTGSAVLCSTRILNRAPGDLDFGIREPLNEGDVKVLMDFFNLQERLNIDRYGDIIPYHNEGKEKNKPMHEKDILCFEYIVPDGVDSPINNWTNNTLKYVKIDIFTKEKLSNNDLVIMDYFGTKLKVAHPSIPLSYKMRYALNPQIDARIKHKDDLMNISDQYEHLTKDLISVSRLKIRNHENF